MSILSSQFDITSIDNPMAYAALAQVLKIDMTGATSVDAQGTPTYANLAAGLQFPPGTIVMINTTAGSGLGTAIKGDAQVMYDGTGLRTDANQPRMFFVTIDGNVDYSGSFVEKLSVLQGGFTMKTDQYVAGTYTPGKPVTVVGGKIAPREGATNPRYQIYGFVGPAGLDATAGVLEVIVPQGVCAV